MSQYDYEITNSDANTGLTMRAAINAALQALASNNSGATEPTVTYAYMWWADTTTGLLKQRNAANTAWITIGSLSLIYLGLASCAASNEFTATQHLDGDALLWRFRDTGAGAKEWGIRSDGGNLEFCENTGTEVSPTWTVRFTITGAHDIAEYSLKTEVQSGSLVYAADGGASDTYAITLSPAPSAYTVGMKVRFKANTINTGEAKLNVNGLGDVIIKKNKDVTLGDGDIKAGQIVDVTYDGTYFQMQSQTGTSAGTDEKVKASSGDSTAGYLDAKVDNTTIGVTSNQLYVVASGISQSKLKTSSGEVSRTSGGANLTLPGGVYGFYPQIKATGNSLGYIANSFSTGSYVTNIFLGPDSDITMYAQQYYITSSGEVHWIFVLREYLTKKITAMYQAPDHPCFGNGEKPLVRPHPFLDVDPQKHEILIINPHEDLVMEILLRCEVDDEGTPDRHFLQVFQEDYEIDERYSPDFPVIPVTVGLPKYIYNKELGKKIPVTPNYWKKIPEGTPIEPVKKVIPPMAYFITRELKERAKWV